MCRISLTSTPRSISSARAELVERGVDVGEIRYFDRSEGEWRPGADPNHADYGSFADFADPDGNTWVLQEVRVGKSG